MMSPVKELRKISKQPNLAIAWVRHVSRDAAAYIEHLEPLLAQCVQWHVEASTDLLRAQELIAFLQKQIIIEQKAHHEESAKCAILEANYEQVQARYQKLVERKWE